jgi:hypothetical protein
MVANDGSPSTLSNALIEDNVMYNNGAKTLNIDGVTNSVFRNNLIYGYDQQGIVFYYDGLTANHTTGNAIINNTIVGSSGSGAAVRLIGGSSGTTLFNNILIGGGGAALDVTADSTPGMASDYNVVIKGVAIEDSNGNITNTLPLAQWQSGYGQDAHSFVTGAGSLFVNAAGNDYHLKATSPAVDVGASALNGVSAPATDLDGNPRPSGAGYDIGAYELQQAGTLAFSSAAYSAREDAGSVTITVTRAGGSAGAVTVNYATSNGTAKAGVDYVAAAGTLTFAAGQVSQTFTIHILNNPQAGSATTVNLTLSGPGGGAALGSPATAVLTIAAVGGGGVAAATYYVSPAGADGAAGTAAAPWRTLQRAANAVQAGDLVVAQPGLYAGFTLTAGGTAAAPITFYGVPGATIATPTAAGDGIALAGAS